MTSIRTPNGLTPAPKNKTLPVPTDLNNFTQPSVEEPIFWEVWDWYRQKFDKAPPVRTRINLSIHMTMYDPVEEQ